MGLRLWPFVGIALAVAVGVALAPHLLGVVVAGSIFVGVAVVYELTRRLLVRALSVGTPVWYERFQDRLDPLRARMPAWAFGWRGVLLVFSPLWIVLVAVGVHSVIR